VESFERDRGHHEILVLYQFEGGRYEWGHVTNRRCEIGAVEEETHVDKIEGQKFPRVEDSVRFLKAAPGGEELAFARYGEDGQVVSLRGALLPNLDPALSSRRAFFFPDGSARESRYLDYLRVFLSWRKS